MRRQVGVARPGAALKADRVVAHRLAEHSLAPLRGGEVEECCRDALAPKVLDAVPEKALLVLVVVHVPCVLALRHVLHNLPGLHVLCTAARPVTSSAQRRPPPRRAQRGSTARVAVTIQICLGRQFLLQEAARS